MTVAKSLLGSEAEAAAGAFRAWIFDSALPLWSTVGRDRPGFGFVEHLTLSAEPAKVAYKRVRVQARQIYVFSHAHLLGWPGAREVAEDGYDFLLRHAWRADGGWVRSLEQDGRVLDPTVDLYDLAFVLLALAWYGRATGLAEPIDRARRTLDWMERVMASPWGGFYNALPMRAEPRQQNPHMHLLEALLALSATTEDDIFLKRAERLVDLFRRRLFDPKSSTLGEFFADDWSWADGAAGTRVEPGHHYEWVWLLSEYERQSRSCVEPEKSALYRFANRFGRRVGTQLVVDELDRTGFVRDASVRIWPQAEAIKAHLVMAEQQAVVGRPVSAGTLIARLLNDLFERFLARDPPGTWNEHFTPNDELKGERIPSSSLYHIFMAFAELDRVVGNSSRHR
jgi:mannose/cellobiose epimerase-like protein (N-acyl-D-glucosamine 2-epimerase family)